MNTMEDFFKSVLEQDRAPVVLCNLEHTVIYMNPAADERYKSRGGIELLGKSLKNCHTAYANEMIDKAILWFKASRANNIVFIFRNNEENKDTYMIALRDDTGNLIGYYEKHEYRTNETGNLYDMP
ncbi:MAG: PAS domain-containing protein [Bacillota bacterium]|nr:PAS domain-containing protein [Bacillota bacterium]